MVKHFQYTQITITALEASISPDRLTSFLGACGGDVAAALRLYVWNTAISAALYAPLQGLEVALRNALHRELSGVYGAAWYDNPAVPLSPIATDAVQKAKGAIAKNRKQVIPPRVVAELSLGFWVSLLGPGPRGAYEQKLWRPALYKAFPNGRGLRKHIHQSLDRLRTLRNRIAHHEPIFQRRLEVDYANIIEVISWICADTAAWVDHHSVFQEIFAQRP